MATATPEISLLTNMEDSPTNLANFIEAHENGNTSSQSTGTLSSRSFSSGDSISDSSSFDNEISNPSFEHNHDEMNGTIVHGKTLFGYTDDLLKELQYNATNSSRRTTLNDFNSSKSSRSDVVARCFEYASYIPTYSQCQPSYNQSPSVSSFPKESLAQSNELEQKRVNGGGSMNDASSMVGADAVVGLGSTVGQFGDQHLLNGCGGLGSVSDKPFPDHLHSISLNSSSTLPFGYSIGINPFQIWSNAGTNPLPNSNYLLQTLAAKGGSNSVLGNTGSANAVSGSLLDLQTKLLCDTINSKHSPIKRQMMIYHCKFGEFGVTEGQFTEPSGVAVNAQNYIIVADTNNHRIQIFDKDGRFKFQFGECGKRDSQLLYPNRVAVSHITGDIVVTERSPTHQVQIFNQYGQFVLKFGSNILQHPRGLTVDNQGRIIVVECKVMRIIIFDPNGNVLHKFGCSKHLRFPNGVVVNDQEEIFISDNRAHCVKVFNYDGRYLRQIGGEGLTNYPIGVCINVNGEILIADNHNNFNLTIFKQNGEFVSAHESRVKHAQCFDVALISDGSVVLASKDYRVYIYRYAPALPFEL